MSERASGERLPKAQIKKSRMAWIFWLVPIGAALLCFWFVYRDYIAAGPKITLYFQSVEGLEENNSPVKYRGVQVGRVETIAVTHDRKQVAVKARLTASAANLARVGARFWIVRPELKVGAISGLRTIVSGEYIAVQPGDGPRTNAFAGDESEPIVEQAGALHVTVFAPHLGSLQVQSPVFYRGIQVGEVLGYQLGNDAREVTLRLRIHPEYAPLLRVNSKFWNAGGLNFSFGLFHGAELSAESARTLVSGGVEFATPTEFAQPATNGYAFRLYDKAEDAWKNWEPNIPLKLPSQAEANTSPAQMNLK